MIDGENMMELFRARDVARGEPGTGGVAKEPAAVPALPSRAPSQRQYSDVAAQAAQHVLNLERDLDEVTARLQNAMNQNTLMQERINALLHQVQALSDERDWHKNRHVQIETSLRNSAAIILDVLRTPIGATDAVEATDERVKTAVAAMENDLAKTIDGDSPLNEIAPKHQ